MDQQFDIEKYRQNLDSLITTAQRHLMLIAQGKFNPNAAIWISSAANTTRVELTQPAFYSASLGVPFNDGGVFPLSEDERKATMLPLPGEVIISAEQAEALVPGEVIAHTALLHHNFTTHRAAWRSGIEHLSKSLAFNAGERSYWTHELKAFDEAFATIKDCREDGRCQYAIDHGAEDLGHCPAGKCSMPIAGAHAETQYKRGGVSDDVALVMEAFDYGQFSVDMLGPVLRGGVARGLVEPVRAALCRLLQKKHDELYGPGASEKPQYDPNTIYTIATDDKGNAVVRGTRSTSDPHKDTHIMETALEFEQAKRLRNVTIPPHKVGQLWMMTDSPLPYQILDPNGQWIDADEKQYRFIKANYAARLNPEFLTADKDWMRVIVFGEMKDHLALPDGDEARIGPEETLRELNMAAMRSAGDLESVRGSAQGLVEFARRHGVVVTIEQKPLLPPAMGNYESVVSVRLARKAAAVRKPDESPLPPYEQMAQQFKGVEFKSAMTGVPARLAWPNGYDEMVRLVVEVKEKFGATEAKDIVTEFGGVRKIADVPAEKMKAVKEAAEKKLAVASLTFDDLRAANIARLPLFKNCHGEIAHSMPDGSDWTPSDWLEAVVGELGEYANFHKKFRRGDIPLEVFMIHAAKELADVQTYLDILARRCLDQPGKPHATGIDLGRATVEKFNEVSKRVGCEVFLRVGDERDATMEQRRITLNAKTLKQLREICGYIENGGGDSVTIAQDDATREWSLYVGDSIARLNGKCRSYHAQSFHSVIHKAREAEGDKS